MPKEPSVIIINNGESRLFKPIFELFVLVEAISVSTKFRLGLTQSMNIHDYITIECIQIPLEIQLPVFGAIELAWHGTTPDGFVIRIVPKRSLNETPTGPDIHSIHGTLADILLYSIRPTFVEYFETWRPWVMANISGDSAGWPPVWDFARVIRNAISHNLGQLNFTGSRSVSWEQLSYGRSDHGKQVIGADMSFAEILLLIFDLDAALDQHGCMLLRP